jgi:hypothetical protein
MAKVGNKWTLQELHDELARFERELRAARVRESSTHTYVDRASRFLRWLGGE